MKMESQEPPAVLIDQASKWYGQVIVINDLSLAIDGGVTGVLGKTEPENRLCSSS